MYSKNIKNEVNLDIFDKDTSQISANISILERLSAESDQDNVFEDIWSLAKGEAESINENYFVDKISSLEYMKFLYTTIDEYLSQIHLNNQRLPTTEFQCIPVKSESFYPGGFSLNTFESENKNCMENGNFIKKENPAEIFSIMENPNDNKIYYTSPTEESKKLSSLTVTPDDNKTKKLEITGNYSLESNHKGHSLSNDDILVQDSRPIDKENFSIFEVKNNPNTKRIQSVKDPNHEKQKQLNMKMNTKSNILSESYSNYVKPQEVEGFVLN